MILITSSNYQAPGFSVKIWIKVPPETLTPIAVTRKHPEHNSKHRIKYLLITSEVSKFYIKIIHETSTPIEVPCNRQISFINNNSNKSIRNLTVAFRPTLHAATHSKSISPPLTVGTAISSDKYKKKNCKFLIRISNTRHATATVIEGTLNFHRCST